MSEFTIVHYTENGKNIFAKSRGEIRDKRAKIAIDRVLVRVERGNLGEHKPCRRGVWELIIDYGAGYRVYYSIIGKTVVLLLLAGDKISQQRDIDKAVNYLRKYKEEHRE